VTCRPLRNTASPFAHQSHVHMTNRYHKRTPTDRVMVVPPVPVLRKTVRDTITLNTVSHVVSVRNNWLLTLVQRMLPLNVEDRN